MLRWRILRALVTLDALLSERTAVSHFWLTIWFLCETTPCLRPYAQKRGISHVAVSPGFYPNLPVTSLILFARRWTQFNSISEIKVLARAFNRGSIPLTRKPLRQTPMKSILNNAIIEIFTCAQRFYAINNRISLFLVWYEASECR